MNRPIAVASESDQDQPRKPDTALRWRELLADQRGSGLPVTVFCRERGIPQSTFFAWRRRLSVVGVGGIFKPVKIVSESVAKPVSESVVASVVQSGPGCSAVDGGVVDDTADAGSLELLVGGGRRLLVRRGFDRELLLDVLEVVEGKPSRLEARS